MRGPAPAAKQRAANTVINGYVNTARPVVRFWNHQVVGTLAQAQPGWLRNAQAQATGLFVAGIAEINGGNCTMQDGLRVCRGGGGALSQRGGTTYGNTFLTDDPGPVSAKTIAHEKEHVAQWKKYGNVFGYMYTVENIWVGNDPCQNRYEVAADAKGKSYGQC